MITRGVGVGVGVGVDVDVGVGVTEGVGEGCGVPVLVGRGVGVAVVQPGKGIVDSGVGDGGAAAPILLPTRKATPTTPTRIIRARIGKAKSSVRDLSRLFT